jgi:hypothetical protein
MSYRVDVPTNLGPLPVRTRSPGCFSEFDVQVFWRRAAQDTKSRVWGNTLALEMVALPLTDQFGATRAWRRFSAKRTSWSRRMELFVGGRRTVPRHSAPGLTCVTRRWTWRRSYGALWPGGPDWRGWSRAGPCRRPTLLVRWRATARAGLAWHLNSVEPPGFYCC